MVEGKSPKEVERGHTPRGRNSIHNVVSSQEYARSPIRNFAMTNENAAVAGKITLNKEIVVGRPNQQELTNYLS